MKKYNFKEPTDVTKAIENYPLPNLIFAHAYQALAINFNLKILHKWQFGIENSVKKMLRAHFGGLKQLTFYTEPEQIDERLNRFY